MQDPVPTATPHQGAWPPVRLEVDGLQALIQSLQSQSYSVIGPTCKDDVIVLGEIAAIADLPAGVADEQKPGHYRTAGDPSGAFFSHTVGPHAWKRYLQPPLRRLWSARRVDGRFEVVREEGAPPRYAFLGVRPCDLHAIELLDRVFLNGQFVDSGYQTRRGAAFIVAVDCTHPADSCFCASMGTGPRATSGYDLVLTEVCEGDAHYFVAKAGSARGADLLDELPQRPAGDAEVRRATQLVDTARNSMQRTLETAGLRDLLLDNLEHPHWEEIAQRCLACGNCTMVCPTCFCATVEDVTSLGGDHTERWRKSDSCFTVEFSHIFGGSIRQSPYARYRQWMVHKLATWSDQFGEMGCVGCGRCITWCPVGIDITAEAKVFRHASQRGRTRTARATTSPQREEVVA